ncbi:MAG TPA: hypothetical protein VE994_14405 [Terriglobales bacterium]|nr:hypothetical protein [Terriglobales bacterium]
MAGHSDVISRNARWPCGKVNIVANQFTVHFITPQQLRAASPASSRKTAAPMSSEKSARKRNLVSFPPPPDSPEEKAFIDRYLELADKLLTPNLQRETPDEKTEPYHPPSKHKA